MTTANVVTTLPRLLRLRSIIWCKALATKSYLNFSIPPESKILRRTRMKKPLFWWRIIRDMASRLVSTIRFKIKPRSNLKSFIKNSKSWDSVSNMTLKRRWCLWTHSSLLSPVKRNSKSVKHFFNQNRRVDFLKASMTAGSTQESSSKRWFLDQIRNCTGFGT